MYKYLKTNGFYLDCLDFLLNVNYKLLKIIKNLTIKKSTKHKTLLPNNKTVFINRFLQNK